MNQERRRRSFHQLGIEWNVWREQINFFQWIPFLHFLGSISFVKFSWFNFLGSISLVEFSWFSSFVEFLPMNSFVKFSWFNFLAGLRPQVRLGRGQMSKAESSSKTIQSQMKSASQHKGSIDCYKATKSSIWGKAQKEWPVLSVNGCEFRSHSRWKSVRWNLSPQKRQTGILRHFVICVKSRNSLKINKVAKYSFIYHNQEQRNWYILCIQEADVLVRCL